MNSQGDAALVRTFSTRHGPMMGFANDFYVSQSLQVYGEYCPEEEQALSRLIEAGDTVVDVGANIGALTVPLARVCAPGFIYAFEPQHRAFQILCANVVANQVDNVIAYPEALGAEAGWVDLSPMDYGRVGNFGNATVQLTARHSRAVRMTTIDDLALDACHLIKVDVEGFEAEVIMGAKETVGRLRPVLYLENAYDDKQQQLITLVADLGYRQYWHTPPYFSPDNFNGVTVDVFERAGSLNMLCVHRDDPRVIRGLPEIDPHNWTAPF